MATDDQRQPRRAGRPRDPDIDERVLTAVRASLVDVGWDGTSVRGVADRSGVSRPAIARRWPSKAHLVFEALLGVDPDMGAFDGVDVDGWIDGVVDGSLALFDRPEMQASLPGLLAALHDHDDLRRDLWDGFSDPAVALLADLGGDAPRSERDAAATSARAAIAVAAGAALFCSSVVGNDPGVRDAVAHLVRTGLRHSLSGGAADAR